jgi:hypothetical protein
MICFNECGKTTLKWGLLQDDVNMLVIGSIFTEDGKNKEDIIQGVKEAKAMIVKRPT